MRECFLCGRNGAGDPLDRHHIFGGANRQLSERFGLTVDLCHDRCHVFGPDAVHQNAEVMERLHIYGQHKCMEEQGWTVQQFRIVFGKSYIDEADVVPAAPAPAGADGFQLTDLEMPF